MTAVEIADLSYAYPDGTHALTQLNLAINQGDKALLLGANGSGKTTLLHHLIGLLLPQQGQVKVMGLDIEESNLPSLRQRVGLVFDNPDDQLFATTVFDDVAFGPRNLGLSDHQVAARVKLALSLVGAENLTERPPHNLSLGQKKRVAIAGVLAMETEVLLLDEPLSGLDPATARQMLELLEKLHLRGKTIIMSTHDVDMAYAWSDQVIIMNEGQLVAQGTPELLEQAELLTKASLELPLLAQVFANTPASPRTAAAARELLQRLKCWEEL